MAKWELKSSLFGGLQDTFSTVETTLINPLNDIISIIEQFNTVVSSITNVINTLAGTSLPDLGRAALENLQQQVVSLLEDFSSSGVYLLPVLPTTDFVNTSFESIDGGIESFKERVNASCKDFYDIQRPTFDVNSYTAGFVLVFATDSVDTMLSGLSSLETIFGSSFKIPLNIANVSNLNAVSGDSSAILTWNYSDKGFTPSTFVIEEAKFTNGQLSDYSEINTVFNLGTNRYQVNNLINSQQYFYRITPKYIDHTGESAEVSVTPLAKPVNPTSGLTACGNLICEDNDGSIVKKCQVNSLNFTETTGNVNGILCYNGTIVCDQYVNKNCKYNNGTRCTNLATTSTKSNMISTDGKAITINNYELYVNALCQNGKNAQVCDGYTEQNVLRTGAPPNWESISVRRFFPNEVSQLLDQLKGFINSLFDQTKQASDSSQVFSDLLTDNTNFLKSILLELRDLLKQLNDIFGVPSPGIWTLDIEPGIGGTERFLREFNGALNSPPYSSSGYVAGFVILFGNPVQAPVEAAYSVWQKFFSF